MNNMILNIDNREIHVSKIIKAHTGDYTIFNSHSYPQKLTQAFIALKEKGFGNE